MANNALSNGRIQQATVSERLRNDKGKKVPDHCRPNLLRGAALHGPVVRKLAEPCAFTPDIPAIESHNWLLHRHYTRHEYKLCKILIEAELANSNGHGEYANYLKISTLQAGPVVEEKFNMFSKKRTRKHTLLLPSSLQGLILRKEGKIQDSLDCFQSAYNVNSTNVNNVKQIAKSLFIMGSNKRAVEAYLEAEKISILPDWEIYYNLGESCARLNQLQDAKRYLKRSIELTKNAMPYLALAKVYLAEDQVTEARDTYKAVLSYNSENIDATTELGLLYLRQGDVQRAFQSFGTVLAHSPNCAKAILPMAYVMQNHREYDVALSKYKLAAQSIPESPALWNNVGMCFFGKQKFVAAISCLKRAHYLNPLAFLPACNLGIVFLTTGQPASAAIYLCAALSADPKNPMPYLLLGLALKRLDDLEGAEKALTKAYTLSPQDPLVLINFAVILVASGKEDNAAELLTSLNDIMAVVDVDMQVAQTAKKLSMKIQQGKTSTEDENRILNSDEV
ncbi:hypothetical protein KM043_010140 [Ampulex compressa]|nr:hypothetical protein KM043_010140 [Ampulex compressa]